MASSFYAEMLYFRGAEKHSSAPGSVFIDIIEVLLRVLDLRQGGMKECTDEGAEEERRKAEKDEAAGGGRLQFCPSSTVF